MHRREISPSARFYAHRSTPNTPEMNQHSQPESETHSPRPSYREPFEMVSDSPTAHECMGSRSPAYGYHVPEEMISPRMPIPNPMASHHSLQHRVQETLDNDHDCVPGMACHDFNHSTSNDDTFPDFREPPMGYWPLRSDTTQYQTLPLPLFASPAQVPPNGAEQIQFHTAPPPNGARRRSAQFTTSPGMTFQVPSSSGTSSIPDYFLGTPESPIFFDRLGSHDIMPIPTNPGPAGDGTPTISPDDSISTTARSPLSNMNTSSFFSGRRRDFADDVVAIHDVCLAATQWHLERLHVNWELRNGQDVRTGGGPIRSRGRQYGAAERRYSPYTEHTPRRRARSETDLDNMSGHYDCRRAHNKHHRTEVKQNPIPAPTNSLLQNVHHIGTLIWRRAQRDREDVLGAEACACREMNFLHKWCETLVLYNAADFDADPDGCFARVLEAGKGICRELGDWEGLASLEVVETRDGLASG